MEMYVTSSTTFKSPQNRSNLLAGSCGTRCGGKPSGIKRNPKVIMEDEGDFYLIEDIYPSSQTFRMTVESGETMRGVYYAEDKSSYIFLNRHENIEDVMSTCNHEALHAAIFQVIEWEYLEMLNDEITEKWSIKGNNNFKEHNAIRIMLWAPEYFGE